MTQSQQFPKQIQKRVPFSKSQDSFIQLLLDTFPQTQDKFVWKQITKRFNIQFSSSKRTTKQIRNHYQNCLQGNLKKCKFSEEEKNEFRYLLQEEKRKLFEIANDMGRTYQSLKNYYYRTYEARNQQDYVSQNLQDLEGYENDGEFYDIDPYSKT
jgi:hypothetical protein